VRLQARFLPDGGVVVSGPANTARFTRVWAGIGWPDREPGYLCVIGHRTDGLFHALWEKVGGLWELGDAAVEAKQRLLVECLCVDARDRLAAAYLRTVVDSGHAEGVPAEAFSGLAERVSPQPAPCVGEGAVLPVPERIVENYRSALERVRTIVMRGDLLVRDTPCPKLLYALHQPVEELLQSPVMRALVWVLTMLEEAAAGDGIPRVEGPAWYGNLVR